MTSALSLVRTPRASVCGLRVGWLLLSAALLACGAEEPSPEPPNFENVASLSTDPAIADLLSKRLDVAQQRPKDITAWTSLGFAFEANDFNRQAIDAYGHAVALIDAGDAPASAPNDGGSPDVAKTFFRLGATQEERGDLLAAAGAFERASAQRPDLSQAQWRRGYNLLDLGQFDDAESSFQAALNVDAQALPARLGLARVALQKGQGAEAEDILQKILADASNLPYGRFLMADALRQQGRLEEAEALLPGATPTVPAWPDPWQRELQDLRVGFRADMQKAQDALQQGRLDIALPLLEVLHRDHPDKIVATTNLAAAYVASGRAADAIDLLAAVQEEHGQRYTVAMNMAAAQYVAGHLDVALQWSERAQTLDPHKPRPRELAAEILIRQRRLDEAETFLREALRLGTAEGSDPSVQTRQRLGWLAEQRGDWKTAQEEYLQAVQLAPQRGDLAMHLARSFLGLGRPRYAARALEQARQLGVPQPLAPRLDELASRIEEAQQRLQTQQGG